MAFGRRLASPLQANQATHPIVLYLVDKGGNELGVHTKVSMQIIDPRPICPFAYLVHGPTVAEQDFEHADPRCVIRLSTKDLAQDSPGVLSFPNATPAQARNMLYEQVNKRNLNYLYLIFVDSDAKIGISGWAQNATIGHAWDVFEKALLSFLPAVGCPILSGKSEMAEGTVVIDIENKRKI